MGFTISLTAKTNSLPLGTTRDGQRFVVRGVPGVCGESLCDVGVYGKPVGVMPPEPRPRALPPVTGGESGCGEMGGLFEGGVYIPPCESRMGSYWPCPPPCCFPCCWDPCSSAIH